VINSTAIFACSDIEATLAYYKDVLGFQSDWKYGDPPSFGAASVGGVTIMFNLQPELAKRVHGHQHWIKVDEPDELFKMHSAKANIVSRIEDKPWGFREYVVEDLNGYHLRFAGPISGTPPKSKPFPEDVKIERRKPTNEEFAKVCGAAFGYKGAQPEIMEHTWSGVVALSPSAEAIGVLRIMQDAEGWFSIWDVAVLPDWQAQRIGSTMMREAIEMIRQAKPHAIIYLFTFKHAFYQRLGFGLESASFLRL